MSGPNWANPYVGPQAFDAAAAPLFFGRDRETRELAALVTARRVVVLHSPAGAGKSSLIHAALIPALRREEFEVLPVVRVGRTVAGAGAGNRYLLSTILSLEGSGSGDGSGEQPALTGLTLPAYLARRRRSADAPPELLVFDQFEELLTLDPDDHAAKAEFLRQLGEVLGRPRGRRDGPEAQPRWALLSMREEYLGAMASYLRALPTGAPATYRLDVLTGASAVDAIRKPALARGVTFAPGAAEWLVRNLSASRSGRAVGAGPGENALGVPTVPAPAAPAAPAAGPADDVADKAVEPVQLQVVCYRLWERLKEAGRAEVTADAVKQLADVDNALAGYYRDRVAKVAAEPELKVSEWDVRRWFETKLITRGGVRAVVQLGAGGENELAADVVAALEAAFLVRREVRRQMTWLELAHDRLIEPVLRDNREWFAAQFQPFQHQADRWRALPAGERAAALLRGGALVDAERWAAANAARARKPEDDDFLKACREARTTGDRLRMTIYRGWAALGTVGLVVVLVFFRWAVLERRDAEEAAREARKAEGVAAVEKTKAEAAAGTAEREKAKAEEAARKEKESRRAVAQLNINLWNLMAKDASLLAHAKTTDEAFRAIYAWQTLYRFIWPAGRAHPKPYGRLAGLVDELAKAPDEKGRQAVLDATATRDVLSFQLARELKAVLRSNDDAVVVRTWFELREVFFDEAVTVTARLAESGAGADTDEGEHLRAQFRRLYWVKLGVVEVERGPVVDAKIAFRRALDSTPPGDLRPLAKALKAACAQELADDPAPAP